MHQGMLLQLMWNILGYHTPGLKILWDLQTYRWALLGNTVSVPVAEWVGTALMHPLSHKYMCGSSDSKMMSDGLDKGKKHSLRAQQFSQGCQSCSSGGNQLCSLQMIPWTMR